MDVTWLHVSDFHFKAGEHYDRLVVLRALVDAVRRFRAQGRRPDLIFATGDIANSGKPAEYAAATKFFDELLDAAGLQRRQLIVVPGNHDVDRSAGEDLVRTLTTRERVDEYFTPGSRMRHVRDKLEAFRGWYDEYFRGLRRFPVDSTCGPVEVLDVRGSRIAVLPINTACFAQGDDDHGKLLVGRRCLEGGVEQVIAHHAHLRVALMHHPLDWLSDLERSSIKSKLYESVDIVLRGHLHEVESERTMTASGQLVHLAAGAAYQTRNYPNRALYVRLAAAELHVFPIRYEDVPSEVWTTDPSLFPWAPGHEGILLLPRAVATPSPDRSTPTDAPAPTSAGRTPAAAANGLEPELTQPKIQTRRIFLASSSELIEDRKEFELLISRRNKEWMKQGVFLELVVWEDFLDVMSSTRLQDEYNKAIRGCDLFVMLCFTKVGKYTHEEFETAFGQFRASSRPLILTYFKDAAISTGSADEGDLMSLFVFKRKLKELGHFSTPYQNIDALKHHFTGQLEKLATEGFFQPQPGTSTISSTPTNGAAQQLRPYLQWLQARTRSIELRGLTQGLVELPLKTAYVPLRARSMQRHDAAGGSRSRPEAELAERGTDVALDAVLGLGNRLVIVGGPGSGKTTVLLHMAWALATSRLSGEPEPARSRLGLTLAAHELPLPIFVPLAAFARYRRGHAPARERTLARFISHHLIAKQADFDLPEDFLVRLLKDGQQVILLLDGLDEVANEAERAEVRQSVEELVHGREALRVVVTCRAIAYRQGGTALAAGFREINVQPLDRQHIVSMVQQAYACIYPHDTRMTERSADLLRGIGLLEQERRSRLGDDAEALVGSPLLVRLLLIVHVNDRELPDERAALFEKAVEALLKVDYASDQGERSVLAKDWQSFRDLALQLAFHMHQRGPDQGRVIDERALKSALATEDAAAVADFISHARDRGSLVEERDGMYRFVHLAFQEFLVARHLADVIGRKSRDDLIAFLGNRLEDPWWREPILLLAGYQAGTATAARDFLTELSRTGTTHNARFSAAELAATAALEWRRSGEAIRAQCAQRIVQLLADRDALLQSQPVTRARAADRLALLGDPRFDPQRWYLPADDMLGFVYVPADPQFRIGTRSHDAKRVEKIMGEEVPEHEINDAVTPTLEFHIARYPVTVAQFAVFVAAAKLEIGDADALRDRPTRPVRRVSWHEALAYCQWLNDVLAASRTPLARLVSEQGWRVSLPSELEWEVAARGGLRDQIYAWEGGPDPNLGNYCDSEMGSTSGVGCFAANGLGLHDMIGNVWEWTRSVYAPYPYDPKD